MKLIFDRADSPDIFYRCGFHSDIQCLCVENDTVTLYVPGFEFARAEHEVGGRVKVERLEQLSELLAGFTGPFVVPPMFPYSLSQHLSGDINVEQEFTPERKIKSEEEIEHIRDAQNMARQAIQLVETVLHSAEVQGERLMHQGQVLTSEYLKLVARSFLIEHGYDCPELIIASGSQTAQPHNRGSGPIVPGPVIIDIFPKSERTRYHGDMTRTIIVGEHEKSERMLRAVKKAHAACIQACRPGMRASDVHALCIDILSQEGYISNQEQGMIHSLGHGVGLAIHERPGLNPKDDTELQEGMVVTIEPGVYYDVGVRWEDIVVVGRDTL